MPRTARLPLYGLDIETDTTRDGLDPRVARIVAVAVSAMGASEFVATGDEAGLLVALDGQLAAAEPGVLVTWNGGAFDLPFLAARAAMAGVALGLELAWDPGAYRPGHSPLPGCIGAYAATWHGHLHVDAYRAWRNLIDPEKSCGLKAVARTEGFDPVEVGDISRLHEVTIADLRRYVASDASLARRLAERRWRHVRRFIDRLPPGDQLAFV